MARDSPVLDDEDTGRHDSERGPCRGNTGLLHRRSYLKLAGTTAAGAALVGAVSAGTDDEYEVIEATGQTININDGETFENKLIDLTTGGGFTLYARHSTNWAIKNVGFTGYYEGGSFVISVSDVGGNTSTIENVYIGDGASKTGTDFVHGPGAVFLGPEHNGHIDFRRCNVQGYPNNGFYCSAPKNGTVRFEDCYAANNGVTSYRCGSNGDKIVNCVAYNDTTDYGWYHAQNSFVEENGRPVWAWAPGTVVIEDSHFADGPYPYALVSSSDSSVDFRSGAYAGDLRGPVSVGSDVGSNPDLTPPAGCPTTAEAAARGATADEDDGSDSSADDDSDGDDNTDDSDTHSETDIDPQSLENTIVFDGSDTFPLTPYQFTVTETLAPSTDDGASIDETQEADRRRGTGTVDHLHAWRFDGDIVRITIDGDVTVRVNGNEVNPDTYGRALEGCDWSSSSSDAFSD